VQVREGVESQAGKKFAEFVAIEYSTQLVAGTNYFVKVRLQNNECMRLLILQNVINAE